METKTVDYKWDQYFHNICNVVASNSKCLSRKIGAILVQDRSIISTGYNGPPRGIPHCGKRYSIDPMIANEDLNQVDKSKCPRQAFGYKSGEGLKYCIAGHAERNVLINAARSGISTKNGIMYMNCAIPCGDCLIEIINAGIKEIVCTGTDYYDQKSQFLVIHSNLHIRQFSHLQIPQRES